MRKSKGTVDLQALAMGIVMLVVLVGMGIYLTSTMAAGLPANSSAQDAVEAGADALAGFSDWYAIIILVGVFGFIIAYLFGAFGGQKA